MPFKEMMPWKRKELSSRREEDAPFHSLRSEVNRMFDRFSRDFARGGLAEREEPWAGFFPNVDVSETEKEIHVTAEIPGMDEKDLEVTLSGGNLIIRGEKKAEREQKEEHFYWKESSYGSFHRTIPLPAEVEEDKINASYKKGVLEIRLPKTPETRQTRRKIEVH